MMEDFNKKESRKVLTAELKVQKTYLELVPRPSNEDYQRLKDNIAFNGFDDANPIIINEEMIVLDGHTRLQIAKELGLEWAYAIVKDLGDHYDEKIYIIETNLDQRHLTKGQLAALALKVAEIKQEAARERQRKAGDLNLKKGQKNLRVNKESPVRTNSSEPGEQGKVLELAARQVKGVGYDTVQRASKIQKAAQTDPEIAEGWEKVQKGEASVNSVYQHVKEKEKEKENQNGEVKQRPKVVYAKIKSRKEELAYYHKKMQEEEEALNVPREELVDTFRKVAIARNMPMDAVEALMESDWQILEVWKHLRLGLVTPTICWCVVYWKIHVWLRARQGMEPDREFGRMIHQEMKKSACIYMMQFALKLLKYSGWPDKACSLLSGVDRKLFPLMRAYEDRLDLLVDKIRLRPSCPPLFLEKARKLREKGKEDEARSVRTLGVITYLRNKWEKEDELERQRFGGPSNCLMKT
jgi:ParB-like chromosome segregation protein Spo0J